MNNNYDFRVTFEDFFSKKAISNIHSTFLAADHIKFTRAPEMEFNYESELELVYEYNGGLEGKFILKDVLAYNAKRISDRYIQSFENELKQDSFLTVERKHIFYKNKKSKLPVVTEKLDNLDYQLLPYLKDILIEQYYTLFDYLNDKIENLGISQEEKLNFKINKTDVLTLFYLLRREEIFDCQDDNRLGSFLDNYFTYENGDEIKSFKRSRTFLSDIKTGNKSIDKSINRWKKRFKKEDFFNVEPR